MTLRRILILDTETTGLDASKDVAIEVGCIVFDVRHACAVESFASLIKSCDEPTNPVERINRIPTAALAESPSASAVWSYVSAIADRVDAIIAHRADFDRQFVPKKLRDAKPWICSKFDLDWPGQGAPGAGLVHVALGLGLGVATAHRALADCDLLSRSLTRMHEQGHDLEAFLARGLRPKATYQALVSYDDRDKAKQTGFTWDDHTKRWLRRLAKEDAPLLGFDHREVGP